MRFLVDTNIFLDFLLKREPFSHKSKLFFKLSRMGHHQIFLSAMSLRDIGYISMHYTHDWKKSRLIQRSAYEMCSKVVNLTADAGISSIYDDIKDYEDCLMMYTAQEGMCDLIVTNNKKDFQNSKIPAIDIDEANEALAYLNRDIIK